MLEKLGKGLRSALDKVTKAGYVDSAVIESLAEEIRKTLISGDVDVALAGKLAEAIKQRAGKEKPPAGLSAREHVIRIVYEELVKFVGKKPDINLKPRKLLVVGLFGSGKTTSLGKLAKFYQKKGLKVGLIGCDVHRPAAMDQIQQVAKQCAVPVYAPKGQKDPLAIVKTGIEQLSPRADLLLFDSSGRSSLDKELAEELKTLAKDIEPDEVLLVIPADLGQAAREQAEGFSKLVGITGVFITKMDGTAKAGGALTACSVSGAPVKFIGIGEKLEAIEVFDPENFVSRLLGFPDLKTLLEKAKEAIPQEKAKELTERLMEGKFTLDDFYEQIKAVGKMGGLGDMLGSAMPVPKGVDLDQQEKKMKKWGFAIQSMTKKERAEPNLLNESRIRRISKGSGISESQIKEMLKAYDQARKVSKLISAGGMKRGMLAQIAKRFKGIA
ncbi:MAG: signal recognition particle protein [Candidatus Aenigmarchaeota archaeon]|nr:signal recognition particle protein [Candidatus Aenigmarchaeota archaeon]